MALTDKLKGHLFKEVKVALDLQTGSVGWVANKGEAGEKVVSLRPKGENKFELVDNPFTELTVSMPGFAVRTPVDQLKVGDIVLLDDGAAFFVGLSDNGTIDNPVLRIVNTKSGRTMDWSVARNTLLGGKAVMAVRNLSNLFGGTGGGAGGPDFNSLLPLLLLGDGKLGDNKMLLFFLMSQQQGQSKDGGCCGGFNPLLLLLLGDKKGGGKDDLLPLLMMGGGLGGGAAGLLPFLLSGDDAGCTAKKKTAPAA